jgi:serine/threonine-protein kinase RsbW
MSPTMSSPPSSGDFSDRRVLHDQAAIEDVQAVVAKQLISLKYTEAERWAIRLALEEGLSNAFRHGNKNDPHKTVRFECTLNGKEARFEIQDEGPGFDPSSVPDPTDDANIEIPSGRGIMLIRAYMSEVEYHPPGNHLVMKYKRG